MVWFTRFALIGLYAFLIFGIRWMTHGYKVSDRNRRLGAILLIWAVIFALLIAWVGDIIMDDVFSLLMAGWNFIWGLPCILAVLLIYFKTRTTRRLRR